MWSLIFSGAQKQSPVQKNEPNQFIKILNKKIYNLLYINNRMHLCFGDTNHQIVNSELKKPYMKSGIQIANGNEKLYTMLSQVNALQNSRQTIDNTHNSFQPFSCIMTEMLDTLISIYVDKASILFFDFWHFYLY